MQGIRVLINWLILELVLLVYVGVTRFLLILHMSFSRNEISLPYQPFHLSIFASMFLKSFPTP